MASHWQHCVRFDRPEIWTSDLPLQGQTRYRSTNWPVYQTCFLKQTNSAIALHFNKPLLTESQINLYLQCLVFIWCWNKSNSRLRLTPLANKNNHRCLKHVESFPLEKCAVASSHHTVDTTAVYNHDSLLSNIWVQIKNNAKLSEKQLRTWAGRGINFVSKLIRSFVFLFCVRLLICVLHESWCISKDNFWGGFYRSCVFARRTTFVNGLHAFCIFSFYAVTLKTIWRLFTLVNTRDFFTSRLTKQQ